MTPLSRQLQLHADFWRAYAERGYALTPQQVQRQVQIVERYRQHALRLEAQLALHMAKARGGRPLAAPAPGSNVIPLRRPTGGDHAA